MTRIAVIVGSTRTGRHGARVARWVLEQARTFVPEHVQLELLDLAEVDLPLLDEPAPAITGDYTYEHTRRWSRTVAEFDGYVFVVGEHNHAIPASLKNALDHLFAEWNDKAAGVVGYGVHAGGAVAIEQLRVVLAELAVAGVRTAVRLSVGSDIPRNADEPLHTSPRHDQALERMLDELIAWSQALRGVRAAAAGRAAAGQAVAG